MRYLLPLAFLISTPVMAQTQPAPAAVEFAVTAEIERAPDRADFTAGVLTQSPTAAAASRANAERMTKVIAAIRAAGLPERDVQTTGISLQPQYDYSQRGAPPRLTGYQASNTVRIRLRDLDRAGAVLDSLVQSGANQVNGPDFGLLDEDRALDEARRLAVTKAQARGGLYAEALGRRVARISQISESVGFRQPPMPMARMMAQAEAAPSTPVEPGRLTLSVTLNVRIELAE